MNTKQLQTNQEITLSYKIYGSGSPILCIHGLNLDKRMFYQTDYINQFKNRKVIAIDLPGYGDSEMIDTFTIESICELIIHTLKQLNVTHFSVCGYCMGGIFALYLANLYPEKVAEIFLYEAMIIYPYWINLCKTKLFTLGYNFINRTSLVKIFDKIPPLKELSYNNRRLFCDLTWQRDINKTYLDLFQPINKRDYYVKLNEIKTKCNIVVAKNTFNVVLKSATLLQRKIKNTTLIIINNKGHLLFL